MRTFGISSDFLVVRMELYTILSELWVAPLQVGSRRFSLTETDAYVLPSTYFFPTVPIVLRSPDSVTAVGSITTVSCFSFLMRVV